MSAREMTRTRKCLRVRERKHDRGFRRECERDSTITGLAASAREVALSRVSPRVRERQHDHGLSPRGRTKVFIDTLLTGAAVLRPTPPSVGLLGRLERAI